LNAEAAVFKALPQHPNVVCFYEALTAAAVFHLILEYCSGGDLATVIRSQGAQPEGLVRKCLQQLANGLMVLRRARVVHRDLKPANLLLSSSWPHGTLKIADFGLATKLETHSLAATFCGSPVYMAPEVLRGDKYDARADLYSVGVIGFELLSGHVPHQAASPVLVLRSIEANQPQLPPRVGTAEGNLMLRALLQPLPSARLDFEAFASHRYLREGSTPFASDASEAHETLRAQFASFDVDASGSLDNSELHHALNALGLSTSTAEAHAILRHFDADKSGTLELDEFHTLIAKLQRFQSQRVALAHAAACVMPPQCKRGGLGNDKDSLHDPAVQGLKDYMAERQLQRKLNAARRPATVAAL